MKIQKNTSFSRNYNNNNIRLRQNISSSRNNYNCSYNFPSYKYFESLKQIFFMGNNSNSQLSIDEKAKARALRKLERANEKKAKIAHKKQMLEENKPVSTIDEINKTIDILAKAAYPANILSNYSREEIPFYIDDIPCHSLEGFLQALKTPDTELQKELCLKSGASARHFGRQLTQSSNWKKTQTLYWNNVPYKRNSVEYLNLIKKAFETRFNTSETYRKALKDSEGYTLTHSCGKDNPEETVLTEEEFISMLNMLRDKL